MSLLERVRSSERSKPLMVIERLLTQGKISRRIYKELIELREAWRSGELLEGSVVVHREIENATKQEIPRSTVVNWLGKKGYASVNRK